MLRTILAPPSELWEVGQAKYWSDSVTSFSQQSIEIIRKLFQFRRPGCDNSYASDMSLPFASRPSEASPARVRATITTVTASTIG